MTRDDADYYDSQYEMFNSKGWKDFCAECQEVLDNARFLIDACTDPRGLGQLQAALRLRTDIVNREAATTAAHAAQMAEEASE